MTRRGAIHWILTPLLGLTLVAAPGMASAQGWHGGGGGGHMGGGGGWHGSPGGGWHGGGYPAPSGGWHGAPSGGYAAPGWRAPVPVPYRGPAYPRTYVAPHGVVVHPYGRAWVPGYWGVNGVWIGGSWAYPPYAGWVWVAAHWAWNGYQWVWQQGYWAPPSY